MKIIRLCFTAGLAALVSAGLGFNTGHHADLTRAAMSAEGFGTDSTQMAQVENWFVDYFSDSPFAGLKADCAKLHFDNLFSTNECANYWGRLMENTYEAVQRAVRNNDPATLVALQGITLHTVQDFYTHSNWVDYHPKCADGSYQTVTWFDAYPPNGYEIYTGGYPNENPPVRWIETHGTYYDGLNKDEYGRPNWDSGYVIAYKASIQWLMSMKQWVNDNDFWARAQQLTFNATDKRALDYDFEAAFRVSEWINIPIPFRQPAVDGKWKALGSGYPAFFADFMRGWLPTTSRFQNDFKVRLLHRWISDGLRGDLPPNGSPTPPPRFELNRRAVVVRTVRVESLPTGWFNDPNIDPLGTPDFYGELFIGGHPFIESCMQNKDPAFPSWTSIRFVQNDVNAVPIEYAMWDEDSLDRAQDDLCDINPAAGQRRLSFSFNPLTRRCTGDINGVFDRNPAVVAGALPDTKRARVAFFVTSVPLKETECTDSVTVQVRVRRIRAIDSFDSTSAADFYSVVTIGGAVYLTDYVLDKDDIFPDWRQRRFFPKSRLVVPIQIDVFEADGTIPDPNTDDHADIRPANGRSLLLMFNPATGAITGDVTGQAGTEFFISGNEPKRAGLNFSILRVP